MWAHCAFIVLLSCTSRSPHGLSETRRFSMLNNTHNTMYSREHCAYLNKFPLSLCTTQGYSAFSWRDKLPQVCLNPFPFWCCANSQSPFCSPRTLSAIRGSSELSETALKNKKTHPKTSRGKRLWRTSAFSTGSSCVAPPNPLLAPTPSKWLGRTPGKEPPPSFVCHVTNPRLVSLMLPLVCLHSITFTAASAAQTFPGRGQQMWGAVLTARSAKCLISCV